MERLTEHHVNKSLGAYMVCSKTCDNHICSVDCKEISEIVDRLAAYEDTGLGPEEVKEHEAAYIEIMTRTYGPLHQEIGKWLQAEKDRRLVVLPCKVGDTLYEVDLPGYGVIICKAIHISTYNGPRAHVPGNTMIFAVSVGVEVIEGRGKGSSYAFETEDFGKIVFLTSEEAEAALKKREEEDNEAEKIDQ